MRLLLDTHAFLWWLLDDERLPRMAHDAIAEGSNSIFVSAASVWEIATKHRTGKLPGTSEIIANLDEVLQEQGFKELPITLKHGRAAGILPGPHRDPFDRMLIAQAMIEEMTLVSNERLFDSYAVRRLWR